MLATLGSGPGVGCGQRVVGASEASRGHRDPAHGGGWKPLAASGAQPRRQPPSHPWRSSRLLRDPQPTRARRSTRLLLPRLARRGRGTTGDPPARQARGVPFPRPLSWIPRRRRRRDPAGGGARAQEQGAAGAAVTSTSAGGEGAGRGAGEEEEEEGGRLPEPESAAGSAAWDPSSRLPGGARGRINTSWAPGEKRTLPAPPPAPPAQLSAGHRAARLRRGVRSSSCGRRGAAESGGLGRRRPGRGADERRRLRARAGLCPPSARRPSGAAALGAQGPGR